MGYVTRRRFVQRSLAAGAAFASSPLLLGTEGALAAPARPHGLRLSFMGDPLRSLTSTWTTDGLDDPGTIVEFGPVREGMTKREIRRAPFERMAEGATRRTPGMESLTHSVTLDGLEPGAALRYRVGRPGAWSSVYTTKPLPSGGRTRFVQIGDVGQTADSVRTMEFVRSLRPDCVLIAGDLSYANGVQELWDSWLRWLQALAARVPVMAAPGNHEAKDFGGDTYKARFSYPQTSGGFWSMDMGRVHIAASTGGVFLEDATILDELMYLERDLAAAALRRSQGEIDWVVVMQHYPLWTDHESRGPLNPALILTQEHLFQRYQVDLLMVGHDHFYERSKPMFFGQPLSGTLGQLGRTGYVQVISGGGGQSLYEFVPPEAFQPWSEAHSRRYHAVVYDFEGRSLTVRTLASDGTAEELDAFTLKARHHDDLVVEGARPASALAATLEPLRDVKPMLCRLGFGAAY